LCVEDIDRVFLNRKVSSAFEIISTFGAENIENVNHVYSVPNDIISQFIETLKEWKEIFEDIQPTLTTYLT